MNALKKTLLVFLVASTYWGCKKAEDPEPLPPDMVLNVNDSTANAGDLLTFTIEHPIDNIGSIRWNFGDGSAPITGNDLTRTYSYDNSGTYTVSAEVFGTSGSTVTLTQTVTITGQVNKNGTLTYARVDAYNSNTNLWDYEYTGTQQLPDVYLRVRVRKDNDYEVLLLKSGVLPNFQVDGTEIPLADVPFSIDQLDLLEVTLMNDNTGQGRLDNVICMFTKPKAELLTLHSPATPTSLTWAGTDGASVLYVTFTWN